jgi:hypothetical protein
MHKSHVQIVMKTLYMYINMNLKICFTTYYLLKFDCMCLTWDSPEMPMPLLGQVMMIMDDDDESILGQVRVFLR